LLGGRGASEVGFFDASRRLGAEVGLTSSVLHVVATQASTIAAVSAISGSVPIVEGGTNKVQLHLAY
jgi:hypothetical protein